MVNVLQPKLPSGGVAGTARQAGRDVAGAFYALGVLGVAGLGVLWAYRKAQEMKAKHAAGASAAPAASTPTVSGLFTVG